jgi:hypothetical protein
MNNRPDREDDMNAQDLDALALAHPFADLTESQKALVLSRLGGEEAYARLRSLLLMTRRELLDESTTIEPRPEIRSALHAALESRRHRATPRRLSLGDLLGYRVPAYTAVAGFATAIVLAVMLGRADVAQPPVVRERIVYMPASQTRLVAADREEIVRRVTDSLKAELAKESDARPPMRVATAPVRSPRHGNRGAGVRHAPGSASPRPAAPTSPIASDNQFVGLANLPQLDLQKRGKTLAEDSSFRQFGWSAARDSF